MAGGLAPREDGFFIQLCEASALEEPDTPFRASCVFEETVSGTQQITRAEYRDRTLRMRLSWQLDDEPEEKETKLDKNNLLPAFKQAQEHFKDEGFDRVNPSILKATIQADYLSFAEKDIGFKKFSDVLKALEKQGLLVIEMDDAHTMLRRIC